MTFNAEKLSDVVEQSVFTINAVCLNYGISRARFNAWVGKNKATPNANSMKKIEKIMSELPQRPKMEKHPSYGYATADQIERLKNLGIGPERDRLLQTIERQQKLKGKLA